MIAVKRDIKGSDCNETTIKPNNSGELAQTAPLFASSWLALFDLLYSYFIDRRSTQAEADRANPVISD